MKTKARAFTLLETLTALGVFCFAVLGLLFALQVTADAANNVQREKRIRIQMENRLARLSIPPLREYSAQQPEAGVTYTETVERADVRSQGPAALSGYWKVRVSAAWRDGKDPQTWDASHLVWSPR